MEEIGHRKKKLLWDEVFRSNSSGWTPTRAPRRTQKFVVDLVAKGFRGADKDREDILVATP